MRNHEEVSQEPFRMEFDVSTIKHLGMQMYSTLPPVIGEFVANAWDANAATVEISIPKEQISEDNSEIIIKDDGNGMSDMDIREKYLIVGRDRREQDGSDESNGRKVMGRKGIGKFSAFGIAKVIEIESVKGGEVSHFIMDYDEMIQKADSRCIDFTPLPPTQTVLKGTTIKLRKITKFKNRRISTDTLRRGIARRFSVLGQTFAVLINDSEISPQERNLQQLLALDANGQRYLWEINDEEIAPNTGLTVSGWIGALDRTNSLIDGIDRGISILARGKLVQEPFVFNAVVGQQYALSYIVGEIHAEFVDQAEDTVGTNRNALVWDSDANIKLREWGQHKVNKIAREWSERRRNDNEVQLQESQVYRDFKSRAVDTGNSRAIDLADKLVRQAICENPLATIEELSSIIQMSLDFLEFDKFREVSQALMQSDLTNISRILDLFREWKIIEAMEMSRVTEGRIVTIEKLQGLVDSNALEVPKLHQFLKEFPWALDPRWTLVHDEVSYSELLRAEFPEVAGTIPERNRRIDFLCVKEGTTLVVVEIKRPKSRVSEKELYQIEEYVSFVRDHVEKSSDHELSYTGVVGYLLCGDTIDRGIVRHKVKNLEKAGIYVRKYTDLLKMVRELHREFIKRYNQLKMPRVLRT